MIKRIVNRPAAGRFTSCSVWRCLSVGGGSLPFFADRAFRECYNAGDGDLAALSGRAPEEVEKQVTIPLEIALAGVPIRSGCSGTPSFGLSFIVSNLDEKPSLLMARQLVKSVCAGWICHRALSRNWPHRRIATVRFPLSPGGAGLEGRRVAGDSVGAFASAQAGGGYCRCGFSGWADSPVRGAAESCAFARLQNHPGPIVLALERANANAGGVVGGAGAAEQFLIGSKLVSEFFGEMARLSLPSVTAPLCWCAIWPRWSDRGCREATVGYSDAQGDQDDGVQHRTFAQGRKSISRCLMS